jgi:transcriptional regulator with XRE-family HTH domain
VTVPPELASAVAANTRRLRTARGWSLDTFASRSGVSKGMLVQLEQARTNPSLATLCRVAEALSVTVAALIETSSQPPVKIVAEGEGTTLWTGSQGGSAQLLMGCDEREHIELWRWELAPGDVHSSDPGHADGTLELVHLLDGSLTLVVDEAVHIVPPGGSATYWADRPHLYRNDGDGPCRFVMVILQSDADLQAWAAGRRLGVELVEQRTTSA